MSTVLKLSLSKVAQLTRVDPSFHPGRVHREEGRLVFHSESERKAWLWAVERYRLVEMGTDEYLAPEEHQSLETLERALTR